MADVPVPASSLRSAEIGDRWRDGALTGWVLPVALVTAAALVYANSLANGFALDDEFIVAGNERVHHLLALRDIWLTPYWPHLGPQFGLYRPLTIFLFAVQWALGGGQPWVFHAANVLLHGAVTLLLFYLLRSLVPALPAAVGALLFAVHPVHTEAVANVVGQAEIFSTAAVIAACLVHAARPPGGNVSWGRRGALLLLFLLALLAKESAVMLPALLVLVDVAAGRVRWSRRGLLSYADAMAMPLLLMAAGFACYALVRVDALEGAFLGVDSGPQLGFLKEHRLLNALRAFPELIRLLFYPARLSADYNPAVILPVASITPMVGLGILLLGCSIALALLTPWRPRIGLPAAWFLVAVLPVSNLLFPIGIVVAERTLYLPSVAIGMVAAFAWQALPQGASRRLRITALLGLVVVTLAMGSKTWRRNPDWTSTSAILTTITRDRPESYRAQWLLAATFQNRGDPVRADLHFEAAYRIYPHNSELMTDFAEFLLNQRRPARAVSLLETAYRMHPQILRSASLLVWAYLADGRYADALPVITRVEALGGPLALTMPLRAYAYGQLGQPDRSAAAWRVALHQPGSQSWHNWSFLARALAEGGHDGQALDAAGQAAVAAPDSAARASIAALLQAIRTGCYRPVGSASSATARTLPASREKCDPVGDWLGLKGLQTANPSQNARARADPGPAPAPVRTR